jgi:hypothetical protein
MRTRAMALALIVLGGGGCNAISGASEIDFTRASDAGDGGGGSGDGGSAPYDISCPSGNVIVGFQGRSGLWVDRIGLVCAPVNTGSTLGTTFSETGMAGGEGGEDIYVTCPAGQAAVGTKMWAEVDPPIVKALDLRCQTLTAWKNAGASTKTVKGLGDSDGSSETLDCDPGEANFKVEGLVGGLGGPGDTYVLTANFSCRPYP